MKADKIVRFIFAVSKIIFLTPAVIIGTFHESPVARRSTIRKGPEKISSSELNIYNFHFPFGITQFLNSIELGISVILSNVSKRWM